jgi:beta-mannosidase
LQNKVIDDPFYRDNEAKQQWIGKTNWEYRTTFQVTDALLAHKNLELVFEGLDTYADVISTKNQFSKPTICSERGA